MLQAYARDLDLNLIRVFVVVAETGSVTAAASRLYLTQPAVSAALRRLAEAVGAPLFVRQGRGLVLSARGQRLLSVARPHLEGLVAGALSPEEFDPRVSERTLRVGLSDVSEAWLLPSLLRTLEHEAPRMRVVVLPVQFRTIAQALASGAVDVAVTVADDLPDGVGRRTLFVGGFVCLYDPLHARLRSRGRLTRKTYLAHHHVIVSYNGDLRGVVEDVLGVSRSVRVSVPTFHGVGAIVDGTPLLATVPLIVAQQILARHPKLRVAPLPFRLGAAPMELLWREAVADDGAVRWLMDHVTRIAGEAASGTRAEASWPEGRGRLRSARK